MVAIEQNWTVVPATIVDVQMPRSTRGTLKVAATYQFVFQGQTYTGHRVSLYTADNFGNFYKQAYATLRDYHDRQKAFPAHVNPKNPSEAVLMPCCVGRRSDLSGLCGRVRRRGLGNRNQRVVAI